MSEEAAAEVKPASHDETAAPSTAPELEAKPEGQAEGSAPETSEEPKKLNKTQQRINQLTRQKYEQQQENADLRARLDKLEQAPPPEQATELVAPNEDDFETSQEYHTANAKYYADVSTGAARTEVAASNKSNTEAEQQKQRQKEVETKKAAFEENLEGKRANFEDFEDVAYGHKFMDLDLAEQIFEMDKGPEVAYHLGAHLDEAARIFALAPVQRARELTKLEFQVEALNPKKVSDAPAPINPLGSSEKAETDPDKMDADEWRAWRNNQIHGT